MPKICCASDLHGELPRTVPECDILLIAGDICGGGFDQEQNPARQLQFLRNTVAPWLESIPVKRVVATWGNHDFVGLSRFSHLLPTRLRWDMLVDESVVIDGVKIHGTPWQLPFFDWAFNLPEADLAVKYAKIDADTDIIISHGPPKGFGDTVWSGEQVGSVELRKKIEEVRPKLVVTGHIHLGYGTYQFNNTIIVNASLMNEQYQMVNKVIEIEL
jgi:Icc-related predicted phosphoesterase